MSKKYFKHSKIIYSLSNHPTTLKKSDPPTRPEQIVEVQKTTATGKFNNREPRDSADLTERYFLPMAAQTRTPPKK
jgi:hypothetical protein